MYQEVTYEIIFKTICFSQLDYLKKICADKVDKVKYFIVIYFYYTTDKMNYLHKYNVNLSLLKKY